MREVVAAARLHKVKASSASTKQIAGAVKMSATFNYIFIDGMPVTAVFASAEHYNCPSLQLQRTDILRSNISLHFWHSCMSMMSHATWDEGISKLRCSEM
jgi:hypothetical protein